MKRVLWLLAILSLVLGVLPARGIGRSATETWSSLGGLAPEARQAVAADALRQAIGQEVRVSLHAETGLVRFVGATAVASGSAGSAGRSPDATLAPDASLSPDAPLDFDAIPDANAIEAAARSFLATYGPLFGVQQPDQELATLSREVLDDRRGVIRFQQQVSGVPVFGGEMVLHLRAGRLLAAVAEISPDLAVDLTPAVAPEDAGRRAVEMVAKFESLAPEDLSPTEPSLWLYDPRLVGAPGRQDPRLVWRLNVRAPDYLHVNKVVLVDAHTGVIALHFSEAPSGLARIIYDNNNDASLGLPGSAPVRTENMDLAPGVADVDLAFQYAEDTYRFFEVLGRDSIDDQGMPLISTVRYCPPGAQCPYPNAFWNGEQMAYGAGMVIDDVVAHEMTHGVTEHESRLFYYMQSGAINEGFSDAFGEFVDLTNGRGRDLPEDRWLIGEELPTGIGLPVPLRNLRDPGTRSHPDRMTSLNYRCGTGDYGGVHTNGTVLGKAVYLMTDGDTFNGQTVEGLGITKVSRVLYEAQTNLLTSGSDYADLFDALVQAATHLVGQYGITLADVEQVRRAALATEMHLQPSQCAAVEAPVCDAGSQQVVWDDDLERPAKNDWVTGVLHGAISRWYYPQTDNPYPGWDMTNATSGIYNLWGDADFGGFWYGYGSSFGSSDSYIAMRRAITIPSEAYLRFRHSYSFEETVGYQYDGGMIEYTTDGGRTWLDAGSLISHNGYTGSIFQGSGNPLAGRTAYGGDSNGYISTQLDLGSLAGESVRLRFRIATDDSGGGYGWFIDDVVVYTCSPTASVTPTPGTPTPGTPSPTPPTPTPTATPSATPSPGETLPPGRELTLPLVTRGYVFAGDRTVLSEGFEEAFPGPWLTIDNNPTDGREHVWAKSACRPGAGASSAWAVGGGADGSALMCGAVYPDQVDSWLVYGPFGLEDASAAGLNLRLWLNTVRDQDYLSLMASVDGSHFYGTGISGASGGWVDHGLDLGAVYSLGDLSGQPRVWVAIVFESDGAGAAGEGAYIDDVRLWKTRGSTVSALAPAAEPPSLPETVGTGPITRTLTD